MLDEGANGNNNTISIQLGRNYIEMQNMFEI